MNDVPTPQDALDIASAATRQARTAPAMPRWVPPVGGLLAGGGVFMVNLALHSGGDRNPYLLAAGAAAIVGFYVITRLLYRQWLNGGVMPRSATEEPVQPWKQWAMYWLPMFFICFVGQLMTGWLVIPFGLIVGGWMWFQLARRRMPWLR
ncbi:hypothetical protein [Nocardia terpenica]|uniref:Uncharacterized protein n=1 Tax=Nocardia terpenica TaxID=455432 RepID=A0A164NHC5_9NOCA|nr:hypothetical protein [Nocardia terpenica]KZM74366.1 hypothetical protein AWN90_25115 [Nocardia terpenica]NQE93043.1 hypothetical protein [Nocardia terpenica]